MLDRRRQGQECRQITEDLIKALGDVITTENTAEYFEEKVVNVQKVTTKTFSFLCALKHAFFLRSSLRVSFFE